ncbi:MAG: hypothetical protein KF774_02790 [Planctomyces sp.]|nr:hypothetical protein [Planctomyces sp.]
MRRLRWPVAWLAGAAVALFLAAFPGCVTHRGQSTLDLPDAHHVRLAKLIIHSDVPVQEDSPLVRDLAALRVDILSTLGLPECRRPVVIYLFENEPRYAAYMRTNFPRLPPRRAFFIGTPSELAVYAFRGDQMLIDLRHEYTHGVLHASLKGLPLWLDEALAEFFEPPREANHVNLEHLERLAAAIEGGWQPDLARLEQLSDVSEMQALDYHEAWAWAYTLLNRNRTQQRPLLISYIHSHRDGANSKPFSQKLGLPADEANRLVLKQIARLQRRMNGPHERRSAEADDSESDPDAAASIRLPDDEEDDEVDAFE